MGRSFNWPGSPIFVYGQTDSGRVADGHGVLALLEMARFWRRSDVSLAAIECRRVQRVGLHRAFTSRSKIQGYLYILLGVFVQDDHGHLPVRKCRGICRCVHAYSLEL